MSDGGKKPTVRPPPSQSGLRSIPPPPPSARIPMPPPILEVPANCTVRSLECWSIQGVAGQRESDAFHARAALARDCRFGWNCMGQLVFVYRKGFGQMEYELQRKSPAMSRPTLVDGLMTSLLAKKCK